MTSELQFWFDYSCPYAYLASTQVEAVAVRTGASLRARPMLLGGLFRHWGVSQRLYAELGEAKARHSMSDLARWASVFGVPLQMPAGHPFRTVDALRATLVVGAPMSLIHAFYRAYWVEHRDLADRDVIRSVLAEQGHDVEVVMAEIETEAVKANLKAQTDEAIEHGFWGAPGFVVGDEIYWGQDRLHQVEVALGGSPPPMYEPGPMAPVDVYFDYSSPFAYFGVTRSESVFKEAARYHPMLLGAVFKTVGQANVPMFVMNDAKRRYMALDMKRFCEGFEIPFAFPTQFPLKSVLPLRVTLAAEAHASPEGRRLVHRLFRAYWSDGRDISEPEVIIEVCDEVGLDGPQLIAATQDPAIKGALKERTEAAVAAGVFGAPTFVVHQPERPPSLFWGVDRIELAARAARGDPAIV